MTQLHQIHTFKEALDMYYIAGDMQQLHEREEGSPPYALRASAAEEDPHNGEQPQRFHQVSVSSVLE